MPAANTDGTRTNRVKTNEGTKTLGTGSTIRLQRLQHDHTNMGRELQKYKNLPELQGKELVANQAFLAKVDLLFISGIKNKVATLNDESFQASASFTDSLIYHKWNLTEEERKAASTDVCRTVNEALSSVLVKETQNQEPGVNPLLTRVVLGIYLVHFCLSKINSWSTWCPRSRETSNFLSAMYSKIRHKKERAVPARSLVMTPAQNFPPLAMWKGEFMIGLANILKIAGWGVGNPQAFIAFEQKLAVIFKAVEELRLAFGEKTTSIDLEVHVIPLGIPFDNRWMGVSYERFGQGKKEKSDDIVVGTTGMGLRKFILLPSGEERFENILSPKVILMSNLHETILQPPPSLGPNKKGRSKWNEGQAVSSPSKAPPRLSSKEFITTTNKILSDNRSDNVRHNNEDELLSSAAREILDGTGTAPVIAIINAMLVLRKEIDKVSNFLADNIKRASCEFFKQELDQVYHDSKKIIGSRLSKFLQNHSGVGEVSKFLIKTTVQICMTSFCASEWEYYLDTKLRVANRVQTAKNHKERKAAFLENLISVFKTAAWVIPGSANRATFEESLNPFFKSMKETETALKRVPDFTKVFLSFVPPGGNFGDAKTYAEDASKDSIQESKPSHSIVLGTTALGLRCLFQDRIKGVEEEKPRTLLTAKVILESKLPYISGAKKESKPKTRSGQNTSQHGDGRDP